MNNSQADSGHSGVHADELFLSATLSFRAKGLFGLISTFEDRRGLSAETLAQYSKEGLGAVKAALKELEAAGYLRRHRHRLPDGTLSGVTYVLPGSQAAEVVDATGFAYAITDRSQPFVKIGCSQNVRQRLSALQTSWPGHLEVLWMGPGGAALETHLHDAFASRRVRGEWFDFSGCAAAALIAEAAATFRSAP
ncbi:GIY-YIG nuclease family protein [Kitasatospora sp. NPDC048545]|uniref:GIY-YIG nuclease family protein n=1 Tax=Kitasatospora sp. NPDC048545 TaxID=3157208 RepID=UPI0033F4624C